ncbi:MerR family transcriptional regulator [Spirillospora sp. NPDC029432]|uniref:MerR family transcriptional regulator n=1 Tax=Spirillospora sp. NPDC029432 TaxID=3154599 RepID=UPI003452C8BE
MLTIGELASYAGVTVRAVRHYHAKGLLPEPERDHSGYRRYDAAAVIELIRIRTLAQAGVPLAQVRELLHADEEEFAAAVAAIDRRLRAEIRQREHHREQIARLAAGDHLTLPPEVVEYLDRLRALGIDERIVQVERDGWIPLAALSPDRVAEWMGRKREQIADPRLIDFYRTLSQALARPADDPQLDELADDLAAYLTRMADERGEDYVDDTDIEPPLARLMDALAFDTVPPARRLIELLEQRGWTGWTKLERTPPSSPHVSDMHGIMRHSGRRRGCGDMTETRYFEKSDKGAVRHWEITLDGIRCHMGWGVAGGAMRGSSMTLDDEAHALRHFTKKINEKKRDGYVEVAPKETNAQPEADVRLLDLVGNGGEYEPVAGHTGVVVRFHDFEAGPGPFYEYYIIGEDESRGLTLVVKKPGHNEAMLSAFLDFVQPHLGLAFEGRSHHKVPLPAPIGPFDHVLFCGPSLTSANYDGRLGRVFPIRDCEIGDQDTETYVEARIRGRNAMPSTTWDREPFPVIDLRFDLRRADGFEELRGRTSVREKKFKVYPRTMVERGLRLIAEADPGGFLEIRNYRHEILKATPEQPRTLDEADRFLLGPAMTAS